MCSQSLRISRTVRIFFNVVTSRQSFGVFGLSHRASSCGFVLQAAPAKLPEKIAATRQETALPFTFENAKMCTCVLDAGLAAHVVLSEMDSEEESAMASDVTCIFLIGAAVGHSAPDTASDVIGKVEIQIVHIFLKTSQFAIFKAIVSYLSSGAAEILLHIGVDRIYELLRHANIRPVRQDVSVPLY